MTNKDDTIDENEKEIIKNKVTTTMLQWTRALLPLLIGAIGWYVAQTVAPLDKRITHLEQSHEVFSTHIAKSGTEHHHFLETLQSIETNHRREMDINRRDIDRLEGKVYGYE